MMRFSTLIKHPAQRNLRNRSVMRRGNFLQAIKQDKCFFNHPGRSRFHARCAVIFGQMSSIKLATKHAATQ
ncbi:MAG: hypothetical protein WCH40_04020, partial [Verrucomicrobiales bacterium]